LGLGRDTAVAWTTFVFFTFGTGFASLSKAFFAVAKYVADMTPVKGRASFTPSDVVATLRTAFYVMVGLTSTIFSSAYACMSRARSLVSANVDAIRRVARGDKRLSSALDEIAKKAAAAVTRGADAAGGAMDKVTVEGTKKARGAAEWVADAGARKADAARGGVDRAVDEGTKKARAALTKGSDADRGMMGKAADEVRNFGAGLAAAAE